MLGDLNDLLPIALEGNPSWRAKRKTRPPPFPNSKPPGTRTPARTFRPSVRDFVAAEEAKPPKMLIPATRHSTRNSPGRGKTNKTEPLEVDVVPIYIQEVNQPPPGQSRWYG